MVHFYLPLYSFWFQPHTFCRYLKFSTMYLLWIVLLPNTIHREISSLQRSISLSQYDMLWNSKFEYKNEFMNKYIVNSSFSQTWSILIRIIQHGRFEFVNAWMNEWIYIFSMAAPARHEVYLFELFWQKKVNHAIKNISLCTMAIQVLKFSSGGYKIRKIFA